MDEEIKTTRTMIVRAFAKWLDGASKQPYTIADLNAEELTSNFLDYLKAAERDS
jgi:hypothetical protein